MLESYEYVAAWSAYYLAVIGLLAVWWRITRPLPWTFLKQLLRVLVAAVLLVPAPVAADMSELCPAIFVLLFDVLLIKEGDPLRASVYLLYGSGLGVLVWLADGLLRQLLRRRGGTTAEVAHS